MQSGAASLRHPSCRQPSVIIMGKGPDDPAKVYERAEKLLTSVINVLKKAGTPLLLGDLIGRVRGKLRKQKTLDSEHLMPPGPGNLDPSSWIPVMVGNYVLKPDKVFTGEAVRVHTEVRDQGIEVTIVTLISEQLAWQQLAGCLQKMGPIGAEKQQQAQQQAQLQAQLQAQQRALSDPRMRLQLLSQLRRQGRWPATTQEFEGLASDCGLPPATMRTHLHDLELDGAVRVRSITETNGFLTWDAAKVDALLGLERGAPASAPPPPSMEFHASAAAPAAAPAAPAPAPAPAPATLTATALAALPGPSGAERPSAPSEASYFTSRWLPDDMLSVADPDDASSDAQPGNRPSRLERVCTECGKAFNVSRVAPPPRLRPAPPCVCPCVLPTCPGSLTRSPHPRIPTAVPNRPTTLRPSIVTSAREMERVLPATSCAAGEKAAAATRPAGWRRRRGRRATQRSRRASCRRWDSSGTAGRCRRCTGRRCRRCTGRRCRRCTGHLCRRRTGHRCRRCTGHRCRRRTANRCRRHPCGRCTARHLLAASRLRFMRLRFTRLRFTQNGESNMYSL